MADQETYENKEIPIDIFESMQIDFKPEKPKKRRNYDDYDYNDPFLESFEGEFDAVELECKLENFFIYKGKMEDDPKRIARKYNNSLKKTKLIDSIKNINQKDSEAPKRKLYFEFEKMLINSINPNYKYKKDPKFENLIYWIFYIEQPKDEINVYTRLKILSIYRPEEYLKQFEDLKVTFDMEKCIEELKETIEAQYLALHAVVALDSSFSEDKKSFKLFSDRSYIEKMICFITNFMKFYIIKSDENISHVKNYALDYLNAMLPEQCTNGIKIKHYVSKVIDLKIKEAGYDVGSVKNGNFIKSCDMPIPEIVENPSEVSLSSAYKPSYEDANSSFGGKSSNDVKNTVGSNQSNNLTSIFGCKQANKQNTQNIYSHPVVSAFSNPFINTNQYKTGLNIKNEKSVVIDSNQNSNEYKYPVDSNSLGSSYSINGFSGSNMFLFSDSTNRFADEDLNEIYSDKRDLNYFANDKIEHEGKVQKMQSKPGIEECLQSNVSNIDVQSKPKNMSNFDQDLNCNQNELEHNLSNNSFIVPSNNSLNMPQISKNDEPANYLKAQPKNFNYEDPFYTTKRKSAMNAIKLSKTKPEPKKKDLPAPKKAKVSNKGGMVPGNAKKPIMQVNATNFNEPTSRYLLQNEDEFDNSEKAIEPSIVNKINSGSTKKNKTKVVAPLAASSEGLAFNSDTEQNQLNN